MKNIFVLFLLITWGINGLNAQIADSQSNEIPKIFQLGDDEKVYDELVKGYPLSLLEASNNDVKIAFDKWIDVLEDMQNYADKIRYDIKGVKLRLHVFWNENGSIDHLGYLLRDDSKNVNDAELKAFLKSFVNRSKMDIETVKKFSFYTTATFPVYAERFTGK